MRSVLIGAVESTRTALLALASRGRLPVALVTLPIDAAHRHSDFIDLRPDCAKLGVPVIEMLRSNEGSSIEALRSLGPDVLLVVGWSQLLHAATLQVPRLGTIGYHPSLLPLNRGRAVIPWTILQHATETGSSLFWIDAGVDSGDLAAQAGISVAPDETARSLYDKHLIALADLIGTVSDDLHDGRIVRLPQDHSRATYCARRRPEDGLINWGNSADEVWTLMRASTHPYPGAFTSLRGEQLVCWEALYVGEAPYWGLPGQVQRVSDEGVLVQCGDRKHVLLTGVTFQGAEQPASRVLKVHESLGRSHP